MSSLRLAEIALTLSDRVGSRAVGALDQIDAAIQELCEVKKIIIAQGMGNVVARERLRAETHQQDAVQFENLEPLLEVIRQLRESLIQVGYSR